MQGLILKDFYNMKDNIGPTLITAVCIGLLLMIKGNPSMFVLAVTLASGSIASSCVKMDETAGWGKYEITMPVSRSTIIIEKYVLLFILTLAGMAFGTIVSYVAGTIMGTLDLSKLILYVLSGFALSIISGSLIIFCIFKFGLIKADFFVIICYIVPVAIFFGVLILVKYLGYDFMQGNFYLILTVALPVAAILFTIVTALINISAYRKQQF